MSEPTPQAEASTAQSSPSSPSEAAALKGERRTKKPADAKASAAAAADAKDDNDDTQDNKVKVVVDDDEEEDDDSKKIVIDPTKDLWANITLNVKEANQEVTEVSLLVVGSNGSGKSSLLQRIYSTTEGGSKSQGGSGGGGGGGKKVKPTTALDYSFARRSDRNFSQVAHFWELAQNRQLSSLADIILSPDNIHAVVCGVVVDFFSTEGLGGDTAAAGGKGGADAAFNVLAAWDTAVYWLKKIDSRTSEVLERMRAKSSSTPDRLFSRAQKLCGGRENPDLKRMRLSGLPTILVVNKLDLFFRSVYNNGQLNLNNDSFTLLVKAFRFLAHLYGCHLVFTAASPAASSAGAGKGEKAADTSSYPEAAQKWRSVMSNLLFQTPLESKYVNMDLEREHGAVLVTADKDSFMEIGQTPIVGGAGGGSEGWKTPMVGKASAIAADDGEGGVYGTLGDSELEKWRAALEAAFPAPDRGQQQQQQQRGGGGKGGDFVKELYDTYAEPAVDAMRRQKDEELEQYRKAARLKAKESK